MFPPTAFKKHGVDDDVAQMEDLRRRAAQFIPVNKLQLTTPRGTNNRYKPGQTWGQTALQDILPPRGFITLELTDEDDGNIRTAQRELAFDYEDDMLRDLRTRRKPAKVYEHVLGSGPSAIFQKQYQRYSLRPTKGLHASAQPAAATQTRAVAGVPALSACNMVVKSPSPVEASPPLSPRPQPGVSTRDQAPPSPLPASPRPAPVGQPSVPQLPPMQPGASPSKARPGAIPEDHYALACSRAAQSFMTQSVVTAAGRRPLLTPRSTAAAGRSPAVGQLTPRAAAAAVGAAKSPLTPRAAAAAAKPTTPRAPLYVAPPKPVVPLTPRGLDALRIHVAVNATGSIATAGSQQNHRRASPAACGDDAKPLYDTGMAQILDEMVALEAFVKGTSATAAVALSSVADPLITSDLVVRGDGVMPAAAATTPALARKGAGGVMEEEEQQQQQQEPAGSEGAAGSSRTGGVAARCGCAIM